MAKITVEIECGKEYCNECRSLLKEEDEPYCGIFGEWVSKGPNGYRERLSECLEAEVKE